MNPAGTPIWYELITPDPDEAKRFYDPVMAWEIEARPSGPMDYRMIAVPDGLAGGVMRLSDEMAAGGARAGWLMYVCVDDVDASVAQAFDLGATVRVPPTDIPGVGRFALLLDPQGVAFYVMRGATEGAESAVFQPDSPGRVMWNELRTGDQAGALAFYGALFGWTVSGSMPMGPMGDYVFLTVGDRPLGAAMTAPAGTSSAWSFYTRVPDADEACEAIRAGGGTVMYGPVPVPGGDRVVISADPQGATFGVAGK